MNAVNVDQERNAKKKNERGMIPFDPDAPLVRIPGARMPGDPLKEKDLGVLPPEREEKFGWKPSNKNRSGLRF